MDEHRLTEALTTHQHCRRRDFALSYSTTALALLGIGRARALGSRRGTLALEDTLGGVMSEPRVLTPFHSRLAWANGTRIPLVLAVLLSTLAISPRGAAQQSAQGDCMLAPHRDRIDATLASLVVEREEVIDTAANSRGQSYTIVDMDVSGATDGCVVLAGPIPELAQDRYSWLYDAPDISLPAEHIIIAPARPARLPLQPGDGNTNPTY